MIGGTRSVPVLITGCSSGIGRAAALSLHAAGLAVYATARQVDALADLAAHGLHTLALDVTDEASMTDAVAAVEQEAGPVGVLVNNAGYGLYGPVEQLPMDEIRRQFETNFFGLVRLTQLVLPGMRRRGRGRSRILNVSSMGGRITLPGGAFYHASKYAVEALSNALRMEVAQFGIDVVLIEPGPVKTPWNDVAAASLSAAAPTGSVADADPEGPAAETDPYATYKAAVGASFGRTQAGLVGRLGSTPEDIAKVITQAVTARRPRSRYLINPVAKSLVAMNQVLPARAYDSVLRRQYGLPR
jgi:short-subunit dehydrogenase